MRRIISELSSSFERMLVLIGLWKNVDDDDDNDDGFTKVNSSSARESFCEYNGNGIDPIEIATGKWTHATQIFDNPSIDRSRSVAGSVERRLSTWLKSRKSKSE